MRGPYFYASDLFDRDWLHVNILRRPKQYLFEEQMYYDITKAIVM